MNDCIPPRPRWYYPEVKAATALEFVDEVRTWADISGIEDAGADEREFLAALTLALQESNDAYQAARYLEDFFEWPVTQELIRILDRAYGRMRTKVTQVVMEWVLVNNVTFPAKVGQHVSFRIGAQEYTGEVMELIKKEARAVIQPHRTQQVMPIEAEDVQGTVKGPVLTAVKRYPSEGK